MLEQFLCHRQEQSAKGLNLPTSECHTDVVMADLSDTKSQRLEGAVTEERLSYYFVNHATVLSMCQDHHDYALHLSDHSGYGS